MTKYILNLKIEVQMKKGQFWAEYAEYGLAGFPNRLGRFHPNYAGPCVLVIVLKSSNCCT